MDRNTPVEELPEPWQGLLRFIRRKTGKTLGDIYSGLADADGEVSWPALREERDRVSQLGDAPLAKIIWPESP